MVIKELDHNAVLSLLPVRKETSHKGDYGKLLLLCGSRGYTGAPALSAMGALRTGAGLVYLAVPECIYEIVACKLLEPVIYPLPEKDGKISQRAIEQLDKYLSSVNAVLLGPGLGQNDDVLNVVTHVLRNYKGPVVLDADGINVLAEHRDILRDRMSTTIITPHDAEFARIGGVLTENRVAAATSLAAQLGVIVLLKGHKTVVTDGDVVYINPTGNPGMAVGGSGDVLSGMIVALLGQGLSPVDAAACAAWLHGAAGDICSQEIGQYGMLPSDMISVLPRLLK